MIFYLIYKRDLAFFFLYWIHVRKLIPLVNSYLRKKLLILWQPNKCKRSPSSVTHSHTHDSSFHARCYLDQQEHHRVQCPKDTLTYGQGDRTANLKQTGLW